MHKFTSIEAKTLLKEILWDYRPFNPNLWNEKVSKTPWLDNNNLHDTFRKWQVTSKSIILSRIRSNNYIFTIQTTIKKKISCNFGFFFFQFCWHKNGRLRGSLKKIGCLHIFSKRVTFIVDVYGYKNFIFFPCLCWITSFNPLHKSHFPLHLALLLKKGNFASPFLFPFLSSFLLSPLTFPILYYWLQNLLL